MWAAARRFLSIKHEHNLSRKKRNPTFLILLYFYALITARILLRLTEARAEIKPHVIFIHHPVSHPSQDTTIATTAATMEDTTSTSSSGPRVLTPRSSTTSSSPQPNPLIHSHACQLALASKAWCAHGGNCPTCMVDRIHDGVGPRGILQQQCTCTPYNPTTTTHPGSTRAAGSSTGQLTLESARESVGWLAGQMVHAIARVEQDRIAGSRPRADDAWVINEAGALLARVVPRMDGTSGAFTLDGGKLPVYPEYPDWPTPRPSFWTDDHDDPSAAARRRMKEFSFVVVDQLEVTKREQRERRQSDLEDFEDEIISSIVPRKKQQQKQKQQKQEPFAQPLIVNGSTPYQTATEATASASTGTGTHAPKKQHRPKQQQQKPTDTYFGYPLTGNRHTPARPSSRRTPSPTTTTRATAGSASPSPSPSLYDPITDASGVEAPNNTPTTPTNPFSRWTPPSLPAMSPSPLSPRDKDEILDLYRGRPLLPNPRDEGDSLDLYLGRPLPQPRFDTGFTWPTEAELRGYGPAPAAHQPFFPSYYYEPEALPPFVSGQDDPWTIGGSFNRRLSPFFRDDSAKKW